VPLFNAFAQQAAAEIQPAEVVANAFAERGETNGVYVMMVPKTHKLMKQGGKRRNALAARNAEGEEFILINTDAKGADMEPQTQHEVAHLLAWRLHGEGIKEHGPEWAKICREVVKRRAAEYCRQE